jgi:hypothetical protein
LLAKSVLDAAGGLVLTAEQLTRHRRVCSWCITTAALLVATVPAALPEARAAWRSCAAADRRRRGQHPLRWVVATADDLPG